MSKRNSLTLTVLGGGCEVGANCYHLAVEGYHILLDCGTHPKKEGGSALPEFALLNHAPNALLVSHGHVDHCGAMPYLLRQFPQVRTYTTFPTARIMDRMLHNSVVVMGTIARERGVIDYPLYGHEDVNYAMQSVRSQELMTPFTLGNGAPIQASFHHAGHVLGSASVLLEAPGHTLLYTGDVCATDQELMGRRIPLGKEVRVDTLMIEATHGSTESDQSRNYQAEAQRLGKAIAQVLEGGGTALVPTFALGRTQEILNVIARLQEEGRIPMVPVYASGLGRAIYELYEKFPHYLGDHAQLRPLDCFGRVGNVWDKEVVKRLTAEPSILVATSGMMLENTPSALLAEELVQHKEHGIFFVGYLDQDTLGYKLLHAPPGERLQFCLGRPKIAVALENIQRFHFSAHADREVLQRIVQRLAPKNVVYVHGDPEAVAWMQAHPAGDHQSFAPAVGHSIQLEA